VLSVAVVALFASFQDPAQLDRVTTPGDNERLQLERRMLAQRDADPVDPVGGDRPDGS
jgi:hypothetical protein